MKFEVPLMIPAIHSMRFAVRPSRRALMMGMPPATAPSNATITPLFCAGPAPDRLPIRCDHRPGAPALRADAEQAHVDRFHLSGFLKWNELTAIPPRK